MMCVYTYQSISCVHLYTIENVHIDPRAHNSSNIMAGGTTPKLTPSFHPCYQHRLEVLVLVVQRQRRFPRLEPKSGLFPFRLRRRHRSAINRFELGFDRQKRTFFPLEAGMMEGRGAGSRAGRRGLTRRRQDFVDGRRASSVFLVTFVVLVRALRVLTVPG